MTVDPAAFQEAEIDALRGLGLTDEQILEAAEIAGFFNYINRVTDALGVKSDLKERRAALERMRKARAGR